MTSNIEKATTEALGIGEVSGPHGDSVPRFGALPDVLAFCGSLTMALYYGWTTKDLVWSMWLSSLVVGYLSILSAIAAGLYIALGVTKESESQNGQGDSFAWFALFLAAFMLVFFTMHFGGFHMGHAFFLSAMFPVDPALGAGTRMGPYGAIAAFLKAVIPAYGGFAVMVLFAERHRVFEPLRQARAFVAGSRDPGSSIDPLRPEAVRRVATGGVRAGSYLVAPYVNVVKLHLLIFFFGAAHFAAIPTEITFLVAYSVYFLPTRAFIGALRG